MLLLAVHLSDGYLSLPWWLAGFALAAVLLALASIRLHEDDIPRIALLTAAVFIASSIHVRMGPSSVHLLLGGLVGVLLGRRAPLAVAVGLVLQVLLLGHGGFTTLGINTCLIALPALLAGLLFRLLHRRDALRRGLGRALLVGFSAALLYLGGVFCIALLVARFDAPTDRPYERIAAQLWEPWLLLGGLAFALGAALVERKLENAPEFPLGFLVGVLAVLLTVSLTAFVLAFGAEATSDATAVMALVLVLAHLPIALVEGIVLGVTVGFLAKVKPSLLD